MPSNFICEYEIPWACPQLSCLESVLELFRLFRTEIVKGQLRRCKHPDLCALCRSDIVFSALLFSFCSCCRTVIRPEEESTSFHESPIHSPSLRPARRHNTKARPIASCAHADRKTGISLSDNSCISGFCAFGMPVASHGFC